MKSRLLTVVLFCGLLILKFPVASAQDGAPLPVRTVRITPEYTKSIDRIPGFVEHKTIKRPKIALVLSGGGARGVAAIGVFESFEQHGIPIDIIVGTSMGSIAGGLYASGYTTEQLRRLVDTTNWPEVISYSDESARKDMFLDQKSKKEQSFLTVRFRGFEPIIPSAFSTGQRLTNFLNVLALQAPYHPDPSFDELEIQYRAVATDLISGKQIVIGSGNLAEAMRASMAVPLLFTPTVKDSMQLVDGGLISNIPVDVAKNHGANIVVALDVTSPLRPRELLNKFWEIGDQLMGIMMQASNREQLAKADVVIRPELSGHLSSDFTGLDEVIEAGKRAADSTVSTLRAKVFDAGKSESGTGNRFVNARFVFDRTAFGEKASNRIDQLASTRMADSRTLKQLMNELGESGDFENLEANGIEYSDSTTISINANRFSPLTSVEIQGNRKIATDTILTIFKPLLGRNLNEGEGRRALKDVLRMYRERGYSLARLQNVQFDRATGKGVLDIDEGVIYRMDIAGTKKTRDYVIWRELPFAEPDIFDISKVAQGIRNLNGTNLFEQVSVAARREGDKNVVVINVKERSTELLRLGMRIDNERNLQPSFDLRDENFLGIGAELGAGYFGGLRNRNYYAEFKATRIFNSYFTFNLKSYYKLYDFYTYANEPTTDDLHWNRYRTGEYREERLGVSAVVGTQLERLGTMTLEGRLEDQRVWNTSGLPLPGTESFGISSIKIGTLLDTRDRYPFPKEGVVMNLIYESAIVKLIEAVGFTKFFFSYDYYQTAFKRQTIHPRVLIGFADETLPITEQFALGGQNSFFGLAENDSRGRQVFVTSLEYQLQLPFKLIFDTYFKARYDLGSIWSSPENIRLVDLRHGIGVGIALDTPIGPAEFSVGKSFFTRKDILNKPVSYGPFVTYFSIGYAL